MVLVLRHAALDERQVIAGPQDRAANAFLVAYLRLESELHARLGRLIGTTPRVIRGWLPVNCRIR